VNEPGLRKKYKQAKALWMSRSPEEPREFLEMMLSNPVLDGPTLRYEFKKAVCSVGRKGRRKELASHGENPYN